MDRLKTGFDGLTWCNTTGASTSRQTITKPGICMVAMTQLETLIPIYQKLAMQGGGVLDRMLIHHGVPYRYTPEQKRVRIEKISEFSISDLR